MLTVSDRIVDWNWDIVRLRPPMVVCMVALLHIRIGAQGLFGGVVCHKFCILLPERFYDGLG